MTPRRETASDLLDAVVRVPEHVVFRSFAKETVALNLQTGQFHGLNPVAGRMIEVVSRSRPARDAVSQLAEEYGQPDDRIEADLRELLGVLLERRLVELDA
jgi:hypothetical protein